MICMILRAEILKAVFALDHVRFIYSGFNADATIVVNLLSAEGNLLQIVQQVLRQRERAKQNHF